LISIDSYGWIEKLTSGPKANAYNYIMGQVKPYEIITSPIILYEVYKRILNLRDEQTALEVIASIGQTTVVPIDQIIALEAADFSLEYGLHMVDAIVYATARHFSAKLYTSDLDLKELKDVVFI
jgi:predicted nucleic acid-binding protein